MFKICTVCNCEFPVTEEFFYRDKRRGKFSNVCKNCTLEKNRQYQRDNKEKICAQKKEYYENHKEEIAEQGKRYREDNGEKIAKSRHRYYLENTDKIVEYQRQYNENNKEKVAKRNKRNYEQNKDQDYERGKRYRENNQEKVSEYQKNYRKENKKELKEKNKEYRQINREKIQKKDHERYLRDKDKISKYQKLYYWKNIDKIKKRAKEHARANSEKIAKQKREYVMLNREEINRKAVERKKRDPVHNLKCAIRIEICRAFDGKLKPEHTENLLGCSYKFFISYIKKKFYPHPKTGEPMTLRNRGRRGWHLDHIVPLSAFDITDEKEAIRACHYTNFQPLWWFHNLAKGSKTPEEFVIEKEFQNPEEDAD